MNRLNKFLSVTLCLVVGALPFILPPPAECSQVVEYWIAWSSGEYSLQTTELNSLSNSSGVVSSVNGGNATIASGVFYNAQSGGILPGYTQGLYHLHLASIGSAWSANTSFNVYLLHSNDDSTFETSVPTRTPDVVFPILAQTAAQDVFIQAVLPPAYFKAYVVNNGGQTSASSGNYLKVLPVTPQAQ
jgi:hypothetical protein